MKFYALLGILLLASCTPETRKINTEPISPRFNHVFLYVPNVQESISFYTKAFDIEVTNHLKTLTRTDENGNAVESEVNIALLKFPGQDFVFEIGERPDLTNPENGNANFQHVGVDVKDIDAALKRILDAGATLLRPMELVEGNGIATKHVFLTGPHGETVELMQIISGEF